MKIRIALWTLLLAAGCAVAPIAAAQEQSAPSDKERPVVLVPDDVIILIKVSARDDILGRVRELRAPTQWLREAQYGLMFQWGGWGYPPHGPKKPWPKMIDDFDVEAFARMVEDAGAEYVIWSATWCMYHFPAPIRTIDRIAPGHSSQRDLVGDLADALAKRNIRLMLYYHEGHPDPDWGINRPDTKINKPCLSAEQAIELVQRASARGQTLSFNLLMYEDGSVSPESMEVMRALRKAIRGR